MKKKDPRGPYRTIVSVDKSNINDCGVTLSCGHKPNLNPVFTYKVGDICNCYACLDSIDNLSSF